MSKWSVLVIFVVLGVTTLIASPASANLTKAHKDYYSRILSCNDEVKRLADESADRRDHDKTKSVANNCIDNLKGYIDAVNRICDNCLSENKSAVSSAKSNALSAANQALSYAEKVKSQAESKSDATSQLKDLVGALVSWQDSFKNAVRAHNDLRKSLEEQDAAKQSEVANQREMLKDVESTTIRVNEAESRVESLLRKEKELLDATVQASKASKAAFVTLIEMNKPGTPADKITNQQRTYNDLHKAWFEKFQEFSKVSRELEEAENVKEKLRNQAADQAKVVDTLSREINNKFSELIKVRGRLLDFNADYPASISL